MTSRFSYFLIFLFALIFQYECVEFKCEYLDPLKMRLGGTIYVPASSTAPFPIPANFTCTYSFFVPKGTYLRLSVINSLLGKDHIEFTDSVGYVKTLTVSNVHNDELFATYGHGQVRIVTGAGGTSRALLTFEWQKMNASETVIKLRKNESGANVDCSGMQQNAMTFVAESGEKVALNVAHSGYILDNFDSFFIFDGPDTDSPVVGRMSTHVVVPFIPTNQSVTVIGLTHQVVYSNIIANIESNINKYRKYQAAVVIDQYGGSLDSINQTISVTFIAKDEKQQKQKQLYITTIEFKEVQSDDCEMRIISGTPSPVSKNLLSYTPSSPLQISFPQQFPATLFSIELTDCSVYMVLSKNVPDNFYLTNSERLGYVFTPSFLDDLLSPALNFTLSSNETLHFSTTVESVDVVGDDQLAINVFNAKGNSAMSVIVTGNQTGGSAEAMGTSVNIDFSGTTRQGRAKIRYHISKISDNLMPLQVAILLRVLSMWIHEAL